MSSPWGFHLRRSPLFKRLTCVQLHIFMPKLYILSTINTDYILWQLQLIVALYPICLQKVSFFVKIDSFLIFVAINFLMPTLQSIEIIIFIIVLTIKETKIHNTKVGYFSKIVEISVVT